MAQSLTNPESWPATHSNDRNTMQINEQDFAFNAPSPETADLSSTLDWPVDKSIEKGPSTIPKDATPPAHPHWLDSTPAESSSMAAARADAYQRLVSSHTRAAVDPSSSSIAAGDKGKSPQRPRGTNSSSLIRSIRQSRLEPLKKRRWYETVTGEESMSFRFVLTPRSGMKGSKGSSHGIGKKSFAHVPMASEDGSCPELDGPSPKSMTSSSTTSSSSKTLPMPMGGISLGELADGNVESFQKLLACSMFLMSDVPDKTAPIRPLGLNVVQKNGDAGGKRGTMLAMKHERSTDLEKSDMTSGVRRVTWKVRVRKV
jgi:hypothetical protein